MTRLIDADDLMAWSEIVPLTDDGGIDINDFEEKLKSMPTIDAEALKCEHCDHNHGRGFVDCELLPQMFGRVAWENYCSLAAPKEEPDVSEG